LLRIFYEGAVYHVTIRGNNRRDFFNDDKDREHFIANVYRKRLRYFVDGLVVGSEAFIRRTLETMRDHGHYRRRKNPISHLNGIHQSPREQRNTAVSF